MHTVATSCRERLQPRDFEFILQTLTGDRGGGPELESLFEDPGSLLAVLDHEQVVKAVLELPFPLSISPELYFFVLVRRSLKHAGIDDAIIADYVAATLASHAAANPLGPMRLDKPDADFTYHVDFLEALEGISDYDRFFLEVQCGNHFLVLTGLFPKFLRHRADRRGAPDVRYYEGVARSAFLKAGGHPLADEFAVGSIYPRLAECFTETRRALNRMAEDYLFLGA